PQGAKQLFAARTTVLSPNHLEQLSEIDSAHAGYGYESHIHYRIVDQFGRILPMDVPINESFGTEQLADCDPMTWRRGPEEGRLVSPDDWFDQVQGEVLGRRPSALPTPCGPMSPNANLPVCHWAGDWRVGNVRIGTGRPVRLGVVWLKHLGFARSEER